jgi:hypothetical protein
LDLLPNSIISNAIFVDFIILGWEYSRHSGYLPSYLSLMTLFPAFKLGIFTSSNGPGDIIRQAGPGLDGLHRDIFQILTGTIYFSFLFDTYGL